MTVSSSSPKKISRAKAIKLLQALPEGQIFAVRFVAPSLAGKPPKVRQMSCKIDGLPVGEQPEGTAGRTVMNVLPVIDLETARQRYLEGARRQIAKLKSKVAKAENSLERANRLRAAHPQAHDRYDKYLNSLVACTRARLEFLEDKLNHAMDTIDDIENAVRNELARSIVSVTNELKSLRDAFGSNADKYAALKKRWETLDELLKADPMQFLLHRRREIDLRGLLALTIGDVEYAVTTPPEPALPVVADTK